MLQLAVIAVVLVCVALVTLLQADADFRDERGARIEAVATNLANTPLVRDSICGEACSPSGTPDPEGLEQGADVGGPTVVLVSELAFATDRAVALSGADTAWLTDPDGTVLVSSDPTSVGTRLDLEGSEVVRGRAWRGEVDVAGQAAIAGHVPLLDDRGELVGIAAVAQDLPSWGQRLAAAAPDLGLFVGLAALLGIGGTSLLAQLIKRRTRGLEPAEIATLADHREAMLHSIREGVVAVDVDGVVTVANDSARTLLDLPDDVVGRDVDDLDLPTHVRHVLLADDAQDDATLVVGDRIVVANRNRVSAGARRVGTVTTLRDRSELLALQSRVDTHRTITETLRAQTHEFANQLHTISGLVQLREYDEVTALVGDLTRRRAEIADEVAAVVDDPLVSALLVAKASLAAEAGVRLDLAATAPVPRLERELSGDVATVLGNLVDNALDVTGAGDVVTVVLDADDDAVVLEVADTGPGVPDDLTETIFERGWSTKPDVVGGRGIGLALVQMVCARRGGSVGVRNEGGAVFRAVLPRGTVGA